MATQSDSTHPDSPNVSSSPSLRELWSLNPDVDFLNHGSFGATPICVQEQQRDWIQQLECDPIEFLGPERSLIPRLDHVRAVVADQVATESSNIAFVRSATDGVNAVLRSMSFRAGDQILITSHGYNACNNAARFVADRSSAEVVIAELPFPIHAATEVIDAFESSITSRTKLVLVDHVTSSTALVLPIAEIVDLAHRRGAKVLVDGAHAPGLLPVDLAAISADFYTANHHKWWCAPKASGFLMVCPESQSDIHPTVISHGANTRGLGDSRFQSEFNWQGTYDPSSLLSLPGALQFLNQLHPNGMPAVMENNRALALAGRRLILETLGSAEPAPESMIGSMATIPVHALDAMNDNQLDAFRRDLFHVHRIEMPVIRIADGPTCVRISAHAYNDLDQYRRLADVLKAV
ncbi:Isopenicillin N epimerase [Rubripirellula lacrimiformis]|uniref:Isopenicillin N epimerase n=1 Tax=Rubripirellula lacrimiformis TaxID=1930273 RepID=A0A517NE85_9BACT|nr:aminotransferase class V-fold PLP-dependent enzyme [Rubripirellula lacrimiformis]QDT05436.1 Isopenicillin N epimerase [Rubripirellula lacrimiformis]